MLKVQSDAAIVVAPVVFQFTVVLPMLDKIESLQAVYTAPLVAYLEEEAVKTYTQLLNDLDDGKLPQWEDLKASPEAIKYWGLPYNAKFRDVILSIRADECSHREFNHHFADIQKDSFIENHKLEVLNNEKTGLNDKI